MQYAVCSLLSVPARPPLPKIEHGRQKLLLKAGALIFNPMMEGIDAQWV